MLWGSICIHFCVQFSRSNLNTGLVGTGCCSFRVGFPLYERRNETFVCMWLVNTFSIIDKKDTMCLRTGVKLKLI